MFTIIIKEQAKVNLENAAIYYNEQRDGLGYDFLEAVETALHDISLNPFGYQIKYDVFRTKLIKPFPYLLIFELLNNEIIIYQCFGAKDNPAKKHKKK